MFFHSDTSGGWTRLDTRLKLSKLKLVGSKVPTNPSDVAGAVSDHGAVCMAEGCTDLIIPDKSLSFKALVNELETCGLLKPTITAKKTKVKTAEPVLSAAHMQEVFLKMITYISTIFVLRFKKSLIKKLVTT